MTFTLFCVLSDNGYIIYVDIMTAEKLSSILVANMDIIYWSVRLSSRRGGDCVKGIDGADRYFIQILVSLNYL